MKCIYCNKEIRAGAFTTLRRKRDKKLLGYSHTTCQIRHAAEVESGTAGKGDH